MAKTPPLEEEASSTGRRKKSERDSFDVRAEQIYRVATEVFSEHGYVAGTTSEIARRVGLTQPALYHYAKSKHAFLFLICQRIGARMLEGMRAATSLEGDPVDRLRLFISNHVQNVVNERAAFGVYATESRHLRPDALKAIRDQEREYVGTLTALIREAQHDGAVPYRVEAWVLARLAIGSMNWIYRWYHSQVPVPALVADVLAFLGVTSDGDHLSSLDGSSG